MHPGILSAGIENGGHWPWPSKSFWPFWLRILGNLACIENGGQWPWPSRSLGHHFDARNCIQRCSCILISAGQGVPHIPNMLLCCALFCCDNFPYIWMHVIHFHTYGCMWYIYPYPSVPLKWLTLEGMRKTDVFYCENFGENWLNYLATHCGSIVSLAISSLLGPVSLSHRCHKS